MTSSWTVRQFGADNSKGGRFSWRLRVRGSDAALRFWARAKGLWRRFPEPSGLCCVVLCSRPKTFLAVLRSAIQLRAPMFGNYYGNVPDAESVATWLLEGPRSLAASAADYEASGWADRTGLLVDFAAKGGVEARSWYWRVGNARVGVQTPEFVLRRCIWRREDVSAEVSAQFGGSICVSHYAIPRSVISEVGRALGRLSNRAMMVLGLARPFRRFRPPGDRSTHERWVILRDSGYCAIHLEWPMAEFENSLAKEWRKTWGVMERCMIEHAMLSAMEERYDVGPETLQLNWTAARTLADLQGSLPDSRPF